jgi:hypothetical protein
MAGPPAAPGETRMTASYVQVLLLEVAVLAALWWLEHAFI